MARRKRMCHLPIGFVYTTGCDYQITAYYIGVNVTNYGNGNFVSSIKLTPVTVTTLAMSVLWVALLDRSSFKTNCPFFSPFFVHQQSGDVKL